MHHKSHQKLATKSNSANPYCRWASWGAQGRLTKRLNNKIAYISDCDHIIKEQDHASEPYDKPDDDCMDNKNSSALWSCINCTYNNSPLFSKCQLCNAPNYSLQIKPEKNKRFIEENPMTLADHLPKQQRDSMIYGYEAENDELMQIAIQLSYQQNIKNKHKATKPRASAKNMIPKYNHIKRSSFASYWNELQNDKRIRKILSNNKLSTKYLREKSILSDINIQNKVEMAFKMYPK